MAHKNKLSTEQCDTLIAVLKNRFEKNMKRHKDIVWEDVAAKLSANHNKLWSLNEMETSGGEPDVVGFEKENNCFIFLDCAIESPKGRRSYCYDQAALNSRKENKPKNNVLDVAAEMGIEILNEAQYRHYQELENFDMKTSSWIKTPEKIRNLGGALFCDRRYDQVFTYHNGAESYYAARGFRGILKV